MMSAKEKRKTRGDWDIALVSPRFFFPRQIFACAILVERLEQAIQLTASTPEMSTGSVGFSV